MVKSFFHKSNPLLCYDRTSLLLDPPLHNRKARSCHIVYIPNPDHLHSKQIVELFSELIETHSKDLAFCRLLPYLDTLQFFSGYCHTALRQVSIEDFSFRIQNFTSWLNAKRALSMSEKKL